MEKVKRGRPKKGDYRNNVCRICQGNLRITYGNFESVKACVNLFKPSSRKEAFGVVWCESLNNIGITIEDSPTKSQLACNGCYRKMMNLCEQFQFVQKGSSTTPSSEGAKRKSVAVLSPARSSPPNRKTLRTRSPMKGNNLSNKKSLQFVNRQKEDLSRAVYVNALSTCNVHDLETSQGAAVKIIISYPSGDVKSINNLDTDSQSVVKHIALKKWNTASNACLRHEFLAPELKKAFKDEVGRECKNILVKAKL